MNVGDLVQINFNGCLGEVLNIVPTGNFAFVRFTDESNHRHKSACISVEQLTVIN
jgi:hypothetical protein